MLADETFYLLSELLFGLFLSDIINNELILTLSIITGTGNYYYALKQHHIYLLSSPIPPTLLLRSEHSWMKGTGGKEHSEEHLVAREPSLQELGLPRGVWKLWPSCLESLRAHSFLD